MLAKWGRERGLGKVDVYLSELFHPLLGFLTGWVSFFVGFSAALAASSLGCSEYLAEAFPWFVEWGDPGLVKKAMAILVVRRFYPEG